MATVPEPALLPGPVADMSFVVSEGSDADSDAGSEDGFHASHHHRNGRHHDAESVADDAALPAVVSPLELLQAKAAAAAGISAGGSQTATGAASPAPTAAQITPIPAAMLPPAESSGAVPAHASSIGIAAGAKLVQWRYSASEKPRHQRMPYASEPLQAGPLAAFLGGGMRVPLSPPRRRPGPVPVAGQNFSAAGPVPGQGMAAGVSPAAVAPQQAISRADAPGIATRTVAAAAAQDAASAGSTVPGADKTADAPACPWIAAPLSGLRRPPTAPQSLPSCAQRMAGASTSLSAAAQLQALLASCPRPAAAPAAPAPGPGHALKALASPSSPCLPSEPIRYAGGPRATIIVPFVLRRVNWAQGGSAMEHLRGLLTHTATSS